ncbi:hypothetical protein [Jiangella asiatica]|uniref:hypothetical protein n=1 Tax=Jiangella asiatica TaxID=2530372 RepID=UPI0013A5F2A8|nr:hypothetical protein [Jiangella asiatica]
MLAEDGTLLAISCSTPVLPHADPHGVGRWSGIVARMVAHTAGLSLTSPPR